MSAARRRSTTENAEATVTSREPDAAGAEPAGPASREGSPGSSSSGASASTTATGAASERPGPHRSPAAPRPAVRRPSPPRHNGRRGRRDPRRRRGGQACHEVRLADPRLTGQQHQPPAATGDVLPRGIQPGDLGGPTHQRGPGHRREDGIRWPMGAGRGPPGGRLRTRRLLGLTEELGVLPQDALAQGLQLWPGVEPELVGQTRAGGGVGLERLGLSTGPVQRHHEQGAEAFVERVRGDEGLQLADDLAVPAGRELGRDEDLEGRESQLLEPGHLQPRGVDLVELRERPAAPEPRGRHGCAPRPACGRPSPRASWPSPTSCSNRSTSTCPGARTRL